MATVDFDDEEAVLAEVCKALDEDPEDWDISEESGLTSFGEGTVYELTCGRREYHVVKDSDAERALALAIVKQDLEEEPEIFNQSFIESHIDMKKLREALHDDFVNSEIDRLNDERPRDFWREADGYGIEPDVDEDDEDADDEPDPTDEEIEQLAEAIAKDRLKEPMDYLEDIYGKEDAVKQAIEIAGIDVDAAAEEAVDTDGAAHFLSTYDGNTEETTNGLVYWRRN